MANGLANGSLGTVTDICNDPESFQCNICFEAMPLCIQVSFDKYSGPTIYDNESLPITPVTASYNEQNIKCTRKQFPLVLAYAISIHRSQGVTLDKAIVDIEDNEFQAGLTYVALSHVKTLEGLLLKPAFNFDRLTKINKSTAMAKWCKELQHLRNLAH